MKKILLILLLLFLIPLSACGKVKYEFKDGVMYEDGKEASGTFEFKLNGFKAKGTFVNGLADGLLEVYYPDGNIKTKTLFSNAVHLKDEVYYRNGKLMVTHLKDKRIDIFYDDGQLVMSFNLQTGKSSSYHENGNPLFVITRTKSTLYNENNEALFEVKNGESINIGTTLKELEDGTFEILKDNKIIAKTDAKGETLTYLYSSGEKLMTFSSVSGDTEIFFKNGQTFFKVNGVNSRFYYKDGKLLYESNNGEWKFFDRDGKEIMSNFEEIRDIKKID
ncbi:toxin-antitoxin system YwqK family antitoxin [Fusobacterium pseudoperiodonticum]|uniref:Cytoplasmic protein n=1 Tax=Fusobacterium pseudoperiodonticum TaxID=2663009 RepID=A0A2D3NVT2_9FUSO|nr:cytoplasmic protein [Fusobacterium pseudoperiodonticum]ATV59440.1 cytoplasmic protein [Fusobacterium pseudoperiodonticum]